MVRASGAGSATARAVVVLALGVSGCGGEDFANEQRPPPRITLSTTIAPQRVTVSPARFGAGPVALLVSNQTQTSQRLRLRSETLAAGGTRLDQTTGPIPRGGTTSLTADLDPGTYTVAASHGDVGSAALVVGPERPSAQNDLLAP